MGAEKISTLLLIKFVNLLVSNACGFLCKFVMGMVIYLKESSLHFLGTKTIFWDLREPFIDNLYKPSVAQSRLESLIESLDTVWIIFVLSFVFCF